MGDDVLKVTFVISSGEIIGCKARLESTDNQSLTIKIEEEQMEQFTEEWVGAVVEALKNNEDFQNKGAGFDSNIHFRVLKDRKAKLKKDTAFGMWLPTAEPSWFGSKPDEEVDIILEGKAGTYQAVFNGKRNIVAALTIGALKLKKGSLSKLTGNLGAVSKFIEVAGSVA